MRGRFLGATMVAALTVTGLLVGAAGNASATGTGGYDDPSCHPSAAHPSPVVLLHGLGGNGPGNVGPLAVRLAGAGYCTFDLTYGEEVPGVPVGGLVDIHRSALQIRDFIERVRAETGAARVDIIGHSEGGFQSLYIPKALGIAAEVDRVVALAPPTHGTTFANLVTIADDLGIRPEVDQILTTFGCPACDQIITGGPLITELNDGPVAQPGIGYTVIASRSDELVTPTGTAFVDEPGVTNEYVQDRCPADPVGHIGLAYDSDVQEMVANALDPAHAGPVTCSVGLTF